MDKKHPQAEELQAAYRDASWHRCPDLRTPKRAHVLRADDSAACGLVAVMGDPGAAVDVPELLRCRRPGCRERWPVESPAALRLPH